MSQNDPSDSAAVRVPPVIAPPLGQGPVLPYAASGPVPVPPEWTNVEVFGLRPEALRGSLVAGSLARIAMTLVLVTCMILVKAWMNRAGLVEFAIFMCVGMGIYQTVSNIRFVLRMR